MEARDHHLAELFFKGCYRDVLAATVDSEDCSIPETSAAYVIGALAFQGRKLEAEQVFKRRKERLGLEQIIEARFFLGVASTRVGDYPAARRYFGANLRSGRLAVSPAAGFFIQQGVGFYRYFAGKLSQASRNAKVALDLATEAGLLYGKVLASDLHGHTLVLLGDVSAGLAALELSLKWTELLGDGGNKRALEISILLYKAEVGLCPGAVVEGLSRKIAELCPEDSYSLSNLMLELGRQQTIRGQFHAAQATLDQASRLIYATQNRRHEITINYERLTREADAA